MNYLTDEAGSPIKKANPLPVIAQAEKGSRITAATLGLSAVEVTTMSNEIDARGYNAILIKIGITNAKNWTTKLQGSFDSGGTFVDLYEQANTGTMTLMSYQCSADRMILFKGIPDYIKIVATEDADGGAYTAEAQLLNI